MSVLNYGEPEYWNLIFSRLNDDWILDNDFETRVETPHLDFYCNLSAIWPIIESSFIRPKTEACLITGCGRSKVCRTLIQNGVRNLTACDISPPAITAMMKLHRDIEGIRFVITDVREMTPFPDHSFSFVLDKGCLDCLMCSISCFEDCKFYLNEVERILRPNGIFAIISHASQDSRTPLLTGSAFGRLFPWEVDYFILNGGGRDYFGPSAMYILTKPDEHGNLAQSRRKIIASYSQQLSSDSRARGNEADVNDSEDRNIIKGQIIGQSDIDENADRPFLFEEFDDEEEEAKSAKCSVVHDPLTSKTPKGQISTLHLKDSLINRVSKLSSSDKSLE